MSGEAGIGKSRLTRGLIDAVAADEHIRISYQCSPYHTDSALYPTIQQLTRASAIASDELLDAKLDKLEALLGQAVSQPKQCAAILAPLLGLDGAERYGKLDLSRQQLRTRTLRAIGDQLIGLATSMPVLFILEDAHWIDPTTQEFLDECLDRIAHAPVLTLVTARPVFQHGFGGHPIVTKLALNRLGQEQTTAIIAKLTGGKTLPPELVKEITAKTDGIPLFVEELTKTVLESGGMRETDDAYVLDQPMASLSIPSSLHDSLMARLDRMQPVKIVAQTAACIGREFDYALILAVLPPAKQLNEALESLTAAELIYRCGTPPDASYMFKHALVRDAAYESLLKSMRQSLHSRIFAALEEAGALPEILALHAREANLIDQAIDYYRQAGANATARPAFAEAIAYFKQALTLIRTTADSEENLQRKLDLEIQLGHVLYGSSGYSAAETAETFIRARKIVDRLGETPQRFPVYYGNWVSHFGRSEMAEALEVAREIVTSVDRQTDDNAASVAYRMLAASKVMDGGHLTARDHLKRAAEL